MLVHATVSGGVEALPLSLPLVLAQASSSACIRSFAVDGGRLRKICSKSSRSHRLWSCCIVLAAAGGVRSWLHRAGQRCAKQTLRAQSIGNSG